MNCQNLESIIRESLMTMPPSSVDDEVISTIRLRAKRNKFWRKFIPTISVAAAITILLGGGLFVHLEIEENAQLAEEGEIVLDILGLASADEFYADVSSLL
jgi:hypothetical protein